MSEKGKPLPYPIDEICARCNVLEDQLAALKRDVAGIRKTFADRALAFADYHVVMAATYDTALTIVDELMAKHGIKEE